jgi:RimJ/RimL family protein N-acetyltransferase
MKHPEPWPLRHLVLRTPRLELRPDDDAGLLELVDEAYHGVHPPDQMPFGVPWTDAPPEHLGREMLQFYWSERVAVRPERWTINFLVRLDGRVVGTQGIRASDFGILREVGTGSWVGMRHQGRGIGTEMRAAALAFAFDHLGAVRARSSAYVRNRASLRVSERLGYRHDGTSSVVRRGLPTEEVRLLVTPETFVGPDWKLEVERLDTCRPLLGAQ